MGTPDYINFSNGLRAEVKCWTEEMVSYKEGDKVYPVNRNHTYAIALREGGFCQIVDCKILGWLEEPYSDKPYIFDKWGDVYSELSVGIMGESYLFDTKEEK